MMLLRQARKILLTLGLAVFISLSIILSVFSTESWAVSLSSQDLSPRAPQIAAMDQSQGLMQKAEDKAQTVIDKMTGGSNAKVTNKVKQFKSATQAADNNSIENPGYQPGGRTQQAEKQARETTEGIEATAREAFK